MFYDEWENDDDPGYVFVHLSEEEFFSIMEEVRPLTYSAPNSSVLYRTLLFYSVYSH